MCDRGVLYGNEFGLMSDLGDKTELIQLNYL